MVVMMLSALPTEIIHAIYTYLETRDVQNLRQTSRTFGEVGLEYLVSEIDLFITEESVARVEALSLHPVVSKTVKAINICVQICKPYRNQPWLREHEEAIGKITSSIYDLQQSLIESGKFLASVEAILPRLFALQSISIGNAARDRYSYREIVPRSMEPLLESVHWSKEKLLDYSSTPDVDSASQLFEVVLAMIHRSSLQDNNRKFSFKYQYWPYGIVDRDILSLRRGLESLVGLSITTYGFLKRFDNPSALVRKFVAFVMMAPNLTSLEIGSFLWSHIICEELFVPKLKRLSLQNFQVDADVLLELLNRHHTTLELLQLDRIFFSLDETTLIPFFERVKTEAVLTLKSLELPGMLESRTQAPIPYNEWSTCYPDTVPPGRAIRFLICGEKTDMEGERDAVFWHPYDWNGITWTNITSDIQRMIRDADAAAEARDLARRQEYERRTGEII